MKLSIIILSWNTKELLIRCLKSVISSLCLVTSDKKSNTLPTTEIIVVDNGSSDGSVEYVKSVVSDQFLVISDQKLGVKNHQPPITNHQPPITVKLIQNKENLGFAKGNNVGLKEAKGEFIMLLNSDTIVKPGVIEGLVSFLQKNQEGIVSPILELPDGQLQIDYYMRFPNLWQIFLYHHRFFRPIAMKIPLLRRLIVSEPRNVPFAVDQLPATALVAPKTVWDKIGYLDPDYRFFFEDVDWCWRAEKLGIKRWVLPEVKIIHLGGGSWKKKLSNNSFGFYYQFFSSMLLFVRKNYGIISQMIFKWAIIINFLFTFKPSLAWSFYKHDGKQAEFLK